MTTAALTGREWLKTPEGQERMSQMMEPFKRDAERMQESMRRLIEPTLKLQESMRAACAPMLEVQEKLTKAFAPHHESLAQLSKAIRSMGPTLDAVTRIQREADARIISAKPMLSSEIFIRREPRVQTTIYQIRPDELEGVVESAVARALERAQPVQKARASYLLPAGAAVEKVQIKFVDGHTVKVKYPNMSTRTFDYKDLGFVNKKSHNPDTKWEFLRALAENGGQLPTSLFDRRFSRQAKYELSKRLQSFFGLSEDVFYPYKRRAGYALKFVLLAESGSIDEENLLESSFDA